MTKRIVVILACIVLLGTMAGSGYAALANSTQPDSTQPDSNEAAGTRINTGIRIVDERGWVVESTSLLAEREGEPRMIDSFGIWTLEDLGYADLTVPCQEGSREAITISYLLPEGASQGPDRWYVLHLNLHIEFSVERGAGSAEVGAYSNAARAAHVEFRSKRDFWTGAPTLKWYTRSLADGEDAQLSGSTSTLGADFRLSRYLKGIYGGYENGVQPGENTMTFEWEQRGGCKVSSLRILSDSAIECTSVPRPGYVPLSTRLAAVPILPEDQAAIVRAIVLADPGVQELLEGKSYVIDLVTPRDLPQTPEKEIRVDICLDRAYQIEYDWPWPPSPIRNKGLQHKTMWVKEMTVVVSSLEGGEVTGILWARESFLGCGDAGEPAAPGLTEAEKARAIEIVLGDPRVQELIGERDYEVGPQGRIGPWYTSEEDRKIGAALEIGFEEPRWIEYDWTCPEYDEEKYPFPHYRVATFRDAQYAEGLIITVDFEEGKVVALLPRVA